MTPDALATTADMALAKGRAAAPRHNPAAADKTAREFEAFFISQMVSHMFAGIESDGLFGGGHGEEMFRSLLIDEYGKAVAQRGGLGIADSVRAEMLRMQEVE